MYHIANISNGEICEPTGILLTCYRPT